MGKELEVNQDYGGCFGLDPTKGMRAICLGGDKWIFEKPGAKKEIVSPDTTQKALDYINQPVIHMGAL